MKPIELSSLLTIALLTLTPTLRADDKAPAAKAPAVEEPAVEPTDFVQFEDGNPLSKLRTATVTYTDGNGLEVDLIGAIHIADSSYYDALNESFKEYDALLYEMVGSERKGPLQPGDLDSEGRGGNPIRSLQVMMQKALELDYQLSGIDYTAENFVHADMDANTFRRMQEERKEGLLKLVLQSYKAQFQMIADGKAPATMGIADVIKILLSGDTASGLKLVLGRQFDQIEYLITAMEPEDGSVILTERNKVALKVLKEQIEKGAKKIGIFYGAAHLADMEQRLIDDFGLEKGEVTWLDAWTVKNEAPAKASE
ncbi:MAG: hypothetical protein ACR2RV_25495 [Verrucomicrobiales bacterium]